MHVFGKDIEAVFIVTGTVIVIVLLWLLYAKWWLRNYEKKLAAAPSNREAETPAKGATRRREAQHYTNTGSWPIQTVVRAKNPRREARQNERACAAADVRAKIRSLLQHGQNDTISLAQALVLHQSAPKRVVDPLWAWMPFEAYAKTLQHDMESRLAKLLARKRQNPSNRKAAQAFNDFFEKKIEFYVCRPKDGLPAVVTVRMSLWEVCEQLGINKSEAMKHLARQRTASGEEKSRSPQSSRPHIRCAGSIDARPPRPTKGNYQQALVAVLT